MGIQNLNGSGLLVEKLKEEIEFLRGGGEYLLKVKLSKY